MSTTALTATNTWNSLTWQEKRQRLNVYSRNMMPGLRSDVLEHEIEQEGPKIIPKLEEIIQDDDITKSEDRLRAIQYLLVFHHEGFVNTDHLLEILRKVAQSRPNEPFCESRRDAANSLTHLWVEHSYHYYSGATDVLTSIANDDKQTSNVRWDALLALSAPDAITNMDPTKKQNVLETLLSGLISLGRESDADTSGKQRCVVGGIRNIEIETEKKAECLIRRLSEMGVTRGDINSLALIAAITPTEGDYPGFLNQLSNLLIGAAMAIRNDERMTGLLGALLIECAGRDPIKAGHQINSFEENHKLPRGSLRDLRIAVGGEPALSPFSEILQNDLKKYFQEPIFQLNNTTMKMWNQIMQGAQWGFRVRIIMSALVFIVGLGLVIASSFQMIFNDKNSFGLGVTLSAGLASIFYVIYSNPLKDIRQSVADLGTANAVFIGYVHRVLETSHTFSYFYTKERIDFAELQQSSDIIQAAMNSTVDALNRVRDSSEDKSSKLSKKHPEESVDRTRLQSPSALSAPATVPGAN